MAEVRVIKADRDRIVRKGQKVDVVRVAAYCRVSTDTEDQMNSYRSQVKYYTEMILKEPSIFRSQKIKPVADPIKRGDEYVIGYIRGESEKDYYHFRQITYASRPLKTFLIAPGSHPHFDAAAIQRLDRHLDPSHNDIDSQRHFPPSGAGSVLTSNLSDFWDSGYLQLIGRSLFAPVFFSYKR